MEKYLDICDVCASRELDFVFFDLRNSNEIWIKDVPGYRCRDCGEVLLSSGVIEVIDEQLNTLSGSGSFPMQKYHHRVLKGSKLERDIGERFLHSWELIRADGREQWHVVGFRVFGDLKTLVAI